VRPEEWRETTTPWIRPEYAPAYRAAVEWLLPRCLTEEERALAPALLLLLAPLNALVVPCRPVAGSRVNFQVTLSRQTEAGPERVRLTVRTTAAQEDETAGVTDQPTPGQTADPQKAELIRPSQVASDTDVYLAASAVLSRPLACAAVVLGSLLQQGKDPI
jgi:hypothetical protein